MFQRHMTSSGERIIITISTSNRTMTDVSIKVLTIVIVNWSDCELVRHEQVSELGLWIQLAVLLIKILI